MYHPFIEGEKIYLRGLEKDDLKGNMFQWANDAEVTKYMFMGAICKAVGAECYLSPLGSKANIDENNISPPNNIKLEYHNYEHPIYRQLYGDFIPYLSVIDLLFNEGERSLEIIRSGTAQ